MKDMMLLVEPLIPALRRYARSLMRADAAGADDLVQDCLERAITRWHQPAQNAAVAAPNDAAARLHEGLKLRFAGIKVTGPDGAAMPTDDATLDPGGITLVVPMASALPTARQRAAVEDGLLPGLGAHCGTRADRRHGRRRRVFTRIGTVLPPAEARTAHEMMDGTSATSSRQDRAAHRLIGSAALACDQGGPGAPQPDGTRASLHETSAGSARRSAF